VLFSPTASIVRQQAASTSFGLRDIFAPAGLNVWPQISDQVPVMFPKRRRAKGDLHSSISGMISQEKQ
jgi:hypothetical protein